MVFMNQAPTHHHVHSRQRRHRRVRALMLMMMHIISTTHNHEGCGHEVVRKALQIMILKQTYNHFLSFLLVLFFFLLLLQVAHTKKEEEDLGVTPRQPLDRVEPPRTASMLVANMPRKMMEILQTPTPHLYQCRQGVLGSTVRARK